MSGGRFEAWHDPRRIGAAAAVAATGLGMAVMAAIGAPRSYLLVNGAALAIGLAVLTLSARGAFGRRSDGLAMLAGAGGLLATALFGIAIDGVHRWIAIGPVSLQPALVLLPALLLGYARSPTRTATIAMIGTALALALQPDRAMAATLLAGLLVIALGRRGLWLALAAAVAALAVTLARPDGLAPTPFVERIFGDALAFSPLAGAVLMAAAGLLLLPALVRRDRSGAVFAAIWLTLLLASVFGNYPTPVLGFGGSGILGYLLSLATLPAVPRTTASRSRTGPTRPRRPAGDALVPAA